MKSPKATAVLTEFIAGISQAEAACWQLVHARQKPEFLPIRDFLAQIKKQAVDIAMKTTNIEV